MNEKRFIITSGSRCMTSNGCGSYVETRDLKSASRFTYDQAYKILNENMGKRIRRYHTIEEVKSEDDVISITEKRSQTAYVDILELPDGIKHWYNVASELNELVKEASIRKEKLLEMRNEIYNEFSDFKHDVELGDNFNACDGYKIARDLKDILKRRRAIKDELIIVNAVLSSKMGKDAIHVKKSVCGLTTRKYTPRVKEKVFSAQ